MEPGNRSGNVLRNDYMYLKANKEKRFVTGVTDEWFKQPTIEY